MNFSLIFTLTFFLTSSQNAECNFFKFSQLKNIRVYDDIIKSPNDKFSYRAIELANGFKILLIKEENMEIEGTIVVFDAKVGYMSYPKNVPGLARILDQQVFLDAATKKYPEKRQFLKFWHKKDDLPYRHIYADHANIQSNIPSSLIPEALARFSQLFVSPDFSLEMFKQEQEGNNKTPEKDLEDEHNKLTFIFIDDDYPYGEYHIWQYLLRSLSNSTHDFYLPLTEAEQRLNENATAKNLAALDELARFYKKHYSANLMTMVIKSNQSLDKMAELVVPPLSLIPNKNLPVPSWPNNPYGPEQLGYYIEIMTRERGQSFIMLFPCDDYSSYFKSKPWLYVIHILTKDGDNTLKNKLLAKNLVFGIYAKLKTLAKGVSFFEISGDLTEYGFNHIEEVFEIIMHHINYLRTEKIRKWIHREIEDDLKTKFRFFDHKLEIPFEVLLSNTLHEVPPKYCVYNKYMLDEYRPYLIENLLSHLNADNLNIYIWSNTFKRKTDRRETWFNTKYRMKKISRDLLMKLHGTDFDTSHTFPKSNPFLAENFDILKSDDSENSTVPKIILESALSRIWYLKDNFFLLPKVYLHFNLRSPVSTSSSKNAASCLIFSNMIEEALKEVTKDSALGHSQSVHSSVTNSGFYLSIEGYSDKMPYFIASVFKLIAFGNFDQKLFLKAKKHPFKSHKWYTLLDTARYYSNMLQSPNKWFPDDFHDSFKEITFHQIVQFREEFFSKFHLELFAYGNINKEFTINSVNSVIDTIKKGFNINPLLVNENQNAKFISFPDGSNLLYEIAINNTSLSAIYVTFQTSPHSIKNVALNSLIGKIFAMACREQSKEYGKRSPDYLAHCTSNEQNGVNTVQFYIQGHEAPELFDLKVEQIIKSLEEDMTHYKKMYTGAGDRLEGYKNFLIMLSPELKNDTSMDQLFSHYWPEILNEQYLFNRRDVIAEAMKKISNDDLYTYFKEYFGASSPKRRKFAIYMHSVEDKRVITKQTRNERLKYTKITNAADFKSRLPLYELPKHM